jgi:AhpC/TSA family protein
MHAKLLEYGYMAMSAANENQIFHNRRLLSLHTCLSKVAVSVLVSGDSIMGLAALPCSCNHCPYVKAWEDGMVQIQADYGPKGAQLLVINTNDAQAFPADSFPKMQERAKEKKFNFPYLHDATQEVARAYGAERTPEVFVFDKHGVLRYHGAIDDNYDNPSAVKEVYLRSALDAVLAGQTPKIAQTQPAGCTMKWK